MTERSFQRSLTAVMFCAALFGAAVRASSAELPPPSHPLELRDGERVALIGGTFIERMQSFAYLETLLTAAHADRDITFRNLGWSGDNVWGHSRAVFNAPDKGFERLIRDLKLADPTLVIVHYGENEAHAGEQGLDKFRAGLQRLLDELGKATGARIVLVGPRNHENLGPPLPSPDAYNDKLALYRTVIEEVAEKKAMAYLNLDTLLPDYEPAPLTYNNVHFTARGYRRLATKLAAKFTPGKDVTIDIFDTERGEQLRQAIIDKNELFFHRHRPQNETYLFLFRKHEQGNNAVEVPQFDPLIESKEEEIARLRKQS